jgi:hypothetical protein
MGCCSRTQQGKVERSGQYTFERIGICSNAKSKPKNKSLQNLHKNTKHTITRFLQTQHKQKRTFTQIFYKIYTKTQKHNHKIFTNTTQTKKRTFTQIFYKNTQTQHKQKKRTFTQIFYKHPQLKTSHCPQCD